MAEEKTTKKKFSLSGKLGKKARVIPFITLGIFIVYVVATFVVSRIFFSVPIVAAGAMIVLACVLAALLNQIPIWVHGLFFIGMIVAGVLFGYIPFMVMVAFVYLLAVVLLYAWMQDYK